MTDRINALTVVLNEDMRDDDVQAIVDAILCLRNVASVTANVADVEDHIARIRVSREIGEQLHRVLFGDAKLRHAP